MNRDPLLTVLRLRRMVLDDASRELADCLRQETEAQQAVTGVETAIARETDVATSLSADDAVVEAFGVWLRRARQDLRAAVAVRQRAEMETTRSRAILAAARAAAKAAEQLMAERKTAEQVAVARREQAVLDEIGGNPRR
ncbi:MAG TPA: flagellar FliJ family protein [Acetobacteraceae bacterium]|nr:flagellar FliJ family protein [Acetobacteraceae bacterium]